MSLNTISIPNTSASLEDSIEQIQDNFRHLSVLWDSVHSVAGSGNWTQSTWKSLPSGLKRQLVNLIGSTSVSDGLVWPQFVYYIANGNQFESLVPFEVHSKAGVKNLVGNGGAKDHCWVIYIDSDKKLQKMICNPFLVNGIGLSGNALKWTYDGQDTGIFVSGPLSTSKTISTHLYIARCISEYNGDRVSGIPTGIENQTQLELSARGSYSPSVSSRSYDLRQVKLIGISDTDISKVESGSPVLVLDYTQLNLKTNASNIWLSTLKKSGNTLYAYCGESNMISVHHTTSGLRELVSKSNSQSSVNFLSFSKNKKLKIYSDNNSLIIDLSQSKLFIEYPVIITRNRDQYNANMIDASEPLLRVDGSVNAQRGVVLRGTDNGSVWGRCVRPINESESVLTLESISTFRNTSVTGRDWVLSYTKRNNMCLEGYNPIVTDDYPQIVSSTQYINTTGNYPSSIPCKALMCNGIAARQAQVQQVQQKTNHESKNSSSATTSPTEYNTFQFDWRCLFEDMSTDSSIGYGSIFSIFNPDTAASATEDISIPTGKYFYSRYGDDLFRTASEYVNVTSILIRDEGARKNFARVCEDYDKIFIIYIGDSVSV